MTEREILLPDIDPLVFFGPSNNHFRFVQSRFPTLRITARGNTVKCSGAEAEMDRFELKMEEVFAYVERHGRMSLQDLERIMEGAVREKVDANDNAILYGPGGLKVVARSVNQQRMVDACANHDMIFAVGPAGSGKTYTAVALAVRALKDKQVKRIILTRPAVEAGENLGFLPGDLKEKLDPYMQPLYDALMDMIPAEKLADYIEKGIIEIAPLAFMRGRTLDKAFVILDEAQNATVSQMKMFLTRMGRDAKFIITGDATQIDLPRNQPSGLLKSIELVRNISGIATIELNAGDVVRHRLVARIIEAFDADK